MHLFPTPSKNVLRRIIVTTSLFVSPIIFTACAAPGSLMESPSRQVPPTADQVSAPSGSSSRPSSSSSWVNEYNHYTVAYANTLVTAGTWLANH